MISDIISKIEGLITPLLLEDKAELVDIQYAVEFGKKVIRVFLDKENGIKLSDCSLYSVSIGDAIDKAGIFADNYTLEVSSPGMDRVLKKEKDFARFKGKCAKVAVNVPLNGQRNFKGEILDAANGRIKISDVTGKTADIDISNIQKARLEPEI